MNLSAAYTRAMNVCSHDIDVLDDLEFYVAETSDQRREGLKGLAGLDKSGMLFVYDEDNSLPFSMQGMDMDIDIAFFDSEGNILKAARYGKGYVGPIFSPAPYRYVIEAPADTLDFSKVNPKNRKSKHKVW